MATWGEFAAEAPEMADLGTRVIMQYGIAYLGTVRADGQPRISPVSPTVFDGGLYLGLMPHTPKRADIARNPKCVLHALPGPQDAEFCVTGQAELVSEQGVDELIRSVPANILLARDTEIYQIQLTRVNCTTFVDPGDGRRPQGSRTVWSAAAVPAA